MPINEINKELTQKINELLGEIKHKKQDPVKIKVLVNSAQIAVGMAKTKHKNNKDIISLLIAVQEGLKDIEEELSSNKKITKQDINKVLAPLNKIKDADTINNNKTDNNKTDKTYTLQKRDTKEKKVFIATDNKTNIEHNDIINSIVPTGLPLLDEELDKGLRVPSSTLIKGEANTGKTAFCVAVTHRGLQDGRNCIFISTNKYPDELKKFAKNIGYNIDNARFIDMYSWLTSTNDDSISSLDLTSVLEFIEDELQKERAEVVVFDSLTSPLLYNDERTVQRFLDVFNAMIKKQNAVSLVVLESGVCSTKCDEVFDYLTDNKIVFDHDKLTLEILANTKPRHRSLRVDITEQGFIVKE